MWANEHRAERSQLWLLGDETESWFIKTCYAPRPAGRGMTKRAKQEKCRNEKDNEQLRESQLQMLYFVAVVKLVLRSP